jgi:hypothetical protein
MTVARRSPSLRSSRVSRPPDAARSGEAHPSPAMRSPLVSRCPDPARSGEAGQASIELVALLPLTLIVGLAILTLLAARAASGQAGAAAQAGAMALIQDTDARAAARAALPPSARRRATISLEDRSITVTVRPETELGFLANTLSATASANAGPEPR